MGDARERPRAPPKRRNQCGALPSSEIEARPRARRRTGSFAGDCEPKCAIRSAGPRLRLPGAANIGFASGPLKQEHLRAETGTECGHQSVLGLGYHALGEPLVKNEKHGGAGKISILREHIPGGLRLLFWQAQLLLDESQELLSSGMEDESRNITVGKIIPLEESVNQPANIGANHFRHIARKNNVKAGIFQIESHGI